MVGRQRSLRIRRRRRKYGEALMFAAISTGAAGLADFVEARTIPGTLSSTITKVFLRSFKTCDYKALLQTWSDLRLTNAPRLVSKVNEESSWRR